MRSDQEIKTTKAMCEKHGEFDQKEHVMPFMKSPIRSRCPACQQVEKDEREESERRQDEIKRSIALRSKLGMAAIPKRFETKAFCEYVADTPEKKGALESCVQYAESFKENHAAGKNMLLIGTPGTGKTHLGVAVANFLNHETRYTAAYRTIGGVLQSIKETYGGDGHESEGKIIAGLTSVDLLVLDEIGATKENPSDFELSTIFAIINGRYESELPTVIISNLAPDGLAKAMGERCVDRLREGSPVVVQLKWKSARRGIL